MRKIVQIFVTFSEKLNFNTRDFMTHKFPETGFFQCPKICILLGLYFKNISWRWKYTFRKVITDLCMYLLAQLSHKSGSQMHFRNLKLGSYLDKQFSDPMPPYLEQCANSKICRLWTTCQFSAVYAMVWHKWGQIISKELFPQPFLFLKGNWFFSKIYARMVILGKTARNMTKWCLSFFRVI